MQRTRARGILRGEGSDERHGARVDDFDKLHNVRPGDAIVTSGLGARFPAGIFVGTVTDAQAPENSLYLRAIVRPAAAFDRAEHVSVLIDRPTPKAPRLGREIDEEPPAAAKPGLELVAPSPVRLLVPTRPPSSGTQARATEGEAVDAGSALSVDAGAP